MILKDLHVHTSYCDGKNTPTEIVQVALEKGLTCIGFSGHAHTPFDESYCMMLEDIEMYKTEIYDLKEKYGDKIEILCGIEQDYYATSDTKKFDYVIGSVHYIKVGDEYLSIDEDAETLRNIVEVYFGGNQYSFAEAYFDTVSNVVEKTNADIIGHLDLLTKFNEEDELFNETNPCYVNAWKKAVDNLLKYDKPFEINMGAISRGYRTTPYPSKDIIEYIKDNGGKLVLSSDSHSADTLCFKFEDMEKLMD